MVVSLLAVAQFIVGCTTEVDYTQGSEFIPSNQHMELRRRVYKNGVMEENGAAQSCVMSSTRLYITDSIRSSNLKNVCFGSEKSDTFGLRKAGFMTQMMFSITLNEERGWGYRPIFDSMTMSLYVTDYHGDTTHKQRFEVYEITSNDYFDLPPKRDTSFYINFDPKPYISQEPIFTFTYPDQDNGIYVGNILDPQLTTVRLHETPTTYEYVSRLMLLHNMAENGDYALDVDSIYRVGNERKFLDVVKGVYIAPSDDMGSSRGAMYATEMENTYMYLYARSRYEEDPAIIRDTVHMAYNFYINPETYNVTAGNVSIATVDHDFSGVSLFDVEDIETSQGFDERDIVSTGFVDGMGGVVTEVMFTDEFIQSLADIVLSRKDAVISVNQARLSVYLDGSDYDYMVLDPMMITPIMDAAMPRLGLYTDYGGKQTISDYIHTMDDSTLAYGGTINRSLACYTMDISTYLQSLMFAASSNLLEDGKSVDLDKFLPASDKSVESLVKHRRFYIGPAVDAIYGFNRQAIIGGDVATEMGDIGNAPITLEVVYTIVD